MGAYTVVQFIHLRPSDLAQPMWTSVLSDTEVTPELAALMDACDGEMWNESGTDVTDKMARLESMLGDAGVTPTAACAVVLPPDSACIRIVTLWYR